MSQPLVDWVVSTVTIDASISDSMGLLSFQGDVSNDAMRTLMKSLNVAPVAPTQLGISVGSVQVVARSAAAKLSQRYSTLQALSFGCVGEVITAIEAAMSTVITAATRLNTVDLGLDAGLQEMSDLLLDCASSFADARALIGDYLARFSDLHGGIVEIHATQLTPLPGAIKLIENAFQPDLDRTTQQFRDARAAAKVQEDAAVSLLKAASALEAKERDARQNSRTWGLVFGILSFGITAAANVDVLGFRAQAASAHAQYLEARRSYETANNLHMVRNYQMRQVREQRLYLAAIQGDSTKLLLRVQALMDGSVYMQQQLGKVKDWVSTLANQVANASNTARNTRDLSVVRQEFVDGFLTICQQVLFDPRLLDEVQAVTDIIDRTPKKSITAPAARTKINELADSLRGKRSVIDVQGRKTMSREGVILTQRAKDALAPSPSTFVDGLPIGDLGLPRVARRA